GILGFCVLGARSDDPVPFEYGRIASGAAIAVACLFAGRYAGAALGGVRGGAVEVLAFLAYPLLLIGLRIVPQGHVRPLLRAVRGILPGRAQRREVQRELERLDGRSAMLL